MSQKMNVTIDDGNVFFAHELSINYNPLQFTLDFKNITPRVDVRNKDAPSVHIKHDVVMMDPYHLKLMLELMTKVVKDYEKKFGKIKKPKALEKMQKATEKKGKAEEKTVKAPSYFG